MGTNNKLCHPWRLLQCRPLSLEAVRSSQRFGRCIHLARNRETGSNAPVTETNRTTSSRGGHVSKPGERCSALNSKRPPQRKICQTRTAMRQNWAWSQSAPGRTGQEKYDKNVERQRVSPHLHHLMKWLGSSQLSSVYRHLTRGSSSQSTETSYEYDNISLP